MSRPTNTTMAIAGSARAAGATNGPDPYPSEGPTIPEALRRCQRRRGRHDPLSFAAGVVVGAGLMLIWLNIIAEVWL